MMLCVVPEMAWRTHRFQVFRRAIGWLMVQVSHGQTPALRILVEFSRQTCTTGEDFQGLARTTAGFTANFAPPVSPLPNC
jgi:hypothetical protein